MAAIKFIKRTVALDGGSVTDPSPNAFFDGEKGAHTFIIAAVRGGEPLTLSGAVSATFLNPNDAVVTITGSIVDGAAVVTLSNNCYALSGRFTLTIDVAGATVYECQSRIKRRSSSTAYDPTGEISVATLSAEIAEMRTATAAANTAAANANAAAENYNSLRTTVEAYPDSVGAATGVTPYAFVGGYYDTPASGAAVNYHEASGFVCTKIPVSAGDTVTLNAASGTGISRLYAFINSSGNAIGRCDTNLSGVRTLIAPSGAVYLAINDDLSKQASGYYAYKGKSIDTQFADVYSDQALALKTGETAVEQITGAYPFVFRPGYYRGATAGSAMTGTITADNEFICAECDCQPGEIVTINGNGSTGVSRMWYIVDANNIVVWSANNSVSGVQSVLVPNTGAKIYINLFATSPNPYAYKGDSIADLIGVLPAYYTSGGYLQERLDKITTIQKNMSANNDAFWLMSDYHYRYNGGNSIHLLKYLSARTGVTRLHYDGDSGGSEGTTAAARLQALQNSAKVWGDLEKSIPEMYGVLGNHEWIASGVFGMGAMMGAYLNRFKTGTEMDGACGGYWIDNKANKVRYFFIQDTVSAYPFGSSVLWFGEQLRQVPEGYSVAVFMHHGFIPSAYTETEYGITVTYNYADIKAVSQLLKNWKTKTNWTYDGHTYVFASGTQNRSVIGVFCAHMHHSTLYNGSAAWAYDADTDGITVFRASEDALNENNIGINGHPWFWWYNSATGQYEKKERTPGTIYEQCFYCIQVDLDSKHLYITAIGGDRDWDCVYES